MKNKDQLIKSAYYDGGKKALDQFIQKNLVYPAAALDKKIEGKVHIFLDINNKGKVTRAKVVSGIGYGCDEEAIRIVKLLEWKVDNVRSLSMIYHHKLTINFRLPITKKIDAEIADNQPNIPQTSVAIQYNYVATPKVEQPENEPQKVVYTYSL